ncbi:serine-rich adhesin for platelets-like [Littorina saxatilis]
MVHTLDLPKSDALNSDDQAKESLTESTSLTIAEDETAFHARCSPTSLDATNRASMFSAESKEKSTHDLVGVFSSKTGAQIKDSSGEDVTSTVESSDEVTMVQHFADDNTNINSALHNAESTDSCDRNAENNSTHDGENTMNGAITSQSLTETVVNVKECTLQAANTNYSEPDTTNAKGCSFEVEGKTTTSSDTKITNSSNPDLEITTQTSRDPRTTGESISDVKFTRVTLIGAEPFSSATLNAGTTNSCPADTGVFTNNTTECAQQENKITSLTDLQARPAQLSTRVLHKVASKPVLVLPTREKGGQKGGGERMNSVRWAHPAHDTDRQKEGSPGEAGVSIPRNDSSASVGTVTSRRSVSRSSTITFRRLKSATMTAAKRGALMVAIFLICYLPLMVILLILSLDHPVYETALLLEGLTLPISYVHALLSPVILMRAMPELRAQAAGVIRWCWCRKRPERPG